MVLTEYTCPVCSCQLEQDKMVPSLSKCPLGHGAFSTIFALKPYLSLPKNWLSNLAPFDGLQCCACKSASKVYSQKGVFVCEKCYGTWTPHKTLEQIQGKFSRNLNDSGFQEALIEEMAKERNSKRKNRKIFELSMLVLALVYCFVMLYSKFG